MKVIIDWKTRRVAIQCENEREFYYLNKDLIDMMDDIEMNSEEREQ